METLRPTVKRDLSLLSVQAWQAGYGKYFAESFGAAYPIIFHYDGSLVRFYHPMGEFKSFKEVVTQNLIKDEELFLKLNAQFQNQVGQLKRLVGNINSNNILDALELAGRIMSFYIFVVSDDFVNAKPEAWASREMSEGVLYQLDAELEKCILHWYSAQRPELAHFVSIEELRHLLMGEQVDWGGVATRQPGYILDSTLLQTHKSFEQYCVEHDFVPPEQVVSMSTNKISGSSAFGGVTQGVVAVVHSREDLGKVTEESIVVTVMTNANFLPYIQLSKAFVTDEGGITCHAAISARELQKPCIVGTKVATHVLHDGDLVEVDATNGIVRILEKAK
ncbi:MAG: hypothetical protein JNK33_01500 [Candidatus Doudnabacteria bacterium]|nr:hypothetical protein [Candidatus Doudnabacteria bacterium]